ncbi:hypothetical protein [Streptomyces sp. CAI-85]|uniref:hypothetical protein n=1 Tax=Streptomyces sp. CAI-85 TaxID=1472662 RepID=UPI0015874083|nr:hypothetical protein [Streptomyces sp. CAI-85]NUV60433.1 hypothetical protein [Streptomyces sp. CAI-85]
MPPQKKARKKPAAEPRRIEAFEGVRNRPKTGRARARSWDEADPAPRPAQGAPSTVRRAQRPPAEVTVQGAGTTTEAATAVDPRSDPEVMFRILSDKIAVKVDRAAMKAGASAAQEVSRRLTAELDAAIEGAQSVAGKMGTLVQHAVQAAVDEALRTAVLNATRVREEHLAQLALIDRTAQTAGDVTAVRLRVEEEMRRSGLTRITVADPDAFNLVNPAEHRGSSAYEVLAPAYVDGRTGQIVQRGEMQRMPCDPDVPGSTEEENER